ncbi:MAG: O-antigen ligase family protein [Sedimentisphaerales bacterium]|nr:O-antigen ligase family protein [Sedimentisphaerales bacterium]
MTKQPTNLDVTKSKGLVYLEYVLLALCLSVLALRATFTEGPAMQSTSQAVNLGDNLYSLSISAVLIFSFIVWIVWSVFSGRFLYHSTGIEIALGLFCIATLIAGFAATDKRLAITDSAMLIAPLLMALLLAQLLDSPLKIKLVLGVITALGVVSAYQCTEQRFVSNQITIEQYEEDPQSMLEPLGIEVGTFQQFMFEHRLYSRGVRGFFTTRNSAGSFAVMAFFATLALFIGQLQNRNSYWSGPRSRLQKGITIAIVIFVAITISRLMGAILQGEDITVGSITNILNSSIIVGIASFILYVFPCESAIVIIAFGLALTRSKGAIAGLFFAGTVFVALLLFGRWIKAHKKILLAVCLLFVIAGVWALVSYGLKHGCLPGGNSMLVRWQYWHAAAQMIADHPLTGVGPGNFSHFYTHYKPAAALESVADPHNFPLSLLTQYGPLGLVAFLAMFFIPLWRALSPVSADALDKQGRNEPAFRVLAACFLITISLALLILRPILMPKTPTNDPAVILYLIVTVYIAPIAVFIIAFLVAAGPLHERRETRDERRNTHTEAALLCAVLGVTLHNLTDFAIFEPGVLTTLWTIMACLIAINLRANPRPPVVLTSTPLIKTLVVISAVAIVGVYLAYALIPVAASTAKIRKANQAIAIGQFDYAHELLEKAAKDDVFSSAASSHNGRLYLHHFQVTRGKNAELLLRAEASLKTAIERNDVAYKNFERLTDVYCELARTSTPKEKNNWLHKALDASSLAIDRYPGCGRLHLTKAQIAEQLGQTEAAIEHYKQAIDIEDQYRTQFRRMYPERDNVVSRLGEEEYKLSKDKIKALASGK